jgi:UDP-N-acetylmuramate--alanine ligase
MKDWERGNSSGAGISLIPLDGKGERLPLSIDGRDFSSLHFAGIMGSGMSAIAQYLAWEGLAISGSDRIAFADEMKGTKEPLEQCGCLLYPQDGSGITPATGALVISTAIEDDNPDIAAARKCGIPIVHRSDALAAIVASHRTIAVCGTSGKSTVTALVFEILRACGKHPSVISGANLIRLNDEGLLGNAFRSDSDTLVIEADESDGTLVKYRPEKAVFLNISKDHQSVIQALGLFEQLAGQTPWVIKNGDDPGLKSIRAAHQFGLLQGAECRPEAVKAVTPSVQFTLKGTDIELPMPGYHNLSNALAALCVCESEGCQLERMVEPLREFRGVLRRFSVSRTPMGVTVIDDYAHNPDKIKAAILTARDFGARIFAVFQPHGYGPTRFLKDELVVIFSLHLRDIDEVHFLPIYYAGGTVKKDISSEDLADRIRERGIKSYAPHNRKELLTDLKQRVKPGDAVILMGARDPTLSLLAQEIRNNL